MSSSSSSSSSGGSNGHGNGNVSAGKDPKVAGSSTAASSQLSYACWDETVRGIANVLAHLRGTWYSTNSANANTAIDYQRERQQLEKYVTPVKYGVGAALALFLNFRVTGSPRFQAWRERWMAQYRQQQKQGNYIPPPPPTSAEVGSKRGGGRRHLNRNTTTTRDPPPPYQPQPSGVGYLEAKREREMKNALGSMRLITDVLVSVSVGTSGTLLLLQAEQDTLRQDFEEAPLVAGKSVVAEQMCDPFLELATAAAAEQQQQQASASASASASQVATHPTDNEQQQQQQQQPLLRLSDSNDNVNDSKNDPNMVTFSKFIANCRRRRDSETRIRNEQKGLSMTSSSSSYDDDAVVAIPSVRCFDP
jgi:hypothetical protein